MPVAAPADKRFRRAHVPPSRRKSWRPTWRTAATVSAICVLSAYALYRATRLVMAAEAFTITQITATGNEHLSRGELLALLDELRGAHMLTTDLDVWRQKLLDSPWVADASIRRVFPGTVSVVISEREPLAIGRIGDGLYLIDRLGTRIDEFGPNYAGFDLPIVDGLAAAPGRNGTLVDERRAALAGRMLADIQTRPDIARLVSQIDVSDERDVVVILEGDSARVRLGDSHFVERLQTYFDLAQALRERVPDIDYVDLRFNERIYVRPLKASAAASAKADGPRTRAEGLRP